ncbi:HNH endonuclease [Mycobacteroides chelonae]|jgi:predicted HNH restriction endonuclease|uniref:HNH endonuclease n=1 Tax=Mycobacteroides chelonae TaxID=1774 RepID=UPI001F483AA7|nr:HNH endonuclease [Mycobacteroides chelonae]
MLRYGPGWKNRRAEIRKRDKVCRACGKTPEQNRAALHVHHLKPFRYGGTNRPENLVALCDSCHHVIEAVTDQALASIQIDITLDGSTLTVAVEGMERWRGSALGAAYPTPTG